MHRKISRLAALIAAAVGTAVAVVATPMSANATTDPHICEAFETPYCIGSPDLNLFTQLDERMPGREITITDLNAVLPHTGFEEFLLKFSADTSKCVAATDSLAFLAVHSCSDDGTVWARDPQSNGNVLWINREATEALMDNNQTLIFLTGLNSGTRFILTTRPGPNGSVQQFHNVA